MDGGVVGNPEKIGVNTGRLEEAIELLEKQRRQGLHAGGQMFVACKGVPVLDVAVGEAKSGVTLRRDSVMLWFSATKPLTSIAIAQQMERGKLNLEDRVQKYIPAVANGKETCTIRHVLTHTGGFPMANFPFLRYDWTTNIQKICEEPAEWAPGTAAGYHPLSGWCVLGEIVRIVDGRPIAVYLKEEIFQPLDMKDSSLGLTAEQVARLGDRLSQITEKTDTRLRLDAWNDPRARPRILPGGNGYGPAHDLGKFYLMLWNGGEWEGKRIVKKETVQLFTSVQRKDMVDKTLSVEAGAQAIPLWGLGFGKGPVQPMPHSWGTLCTSAAYGHGGARSSAGFVEPTRDLVVTIVTNGTPGDLENARRLRELSDTIHLACV